MAGSRKYSVSLPEELAESVRERVGSGGFSAYVSTALEHQVAMDKLGEIVADHESRHGELSRPEIDAARAVLRHEAGSDGAAVA